MGSTFEYVFGTEEQKEILKTKGDIHSELEGYQEVVREYADQTITDRFRVIEKTHTAEDEEGNCYDWYIIDNHYRDTDKFQLDVRTTEQEITDLQIENMEMGEALTNAEIAIMELQDRIPEEV